MLSKERDRDATHDGGFLERPLTKPLFVHVEPCCRTAARELGFDRKIQRGRASRILRQDLFRFRRRLLRHPLRQKAPPIRDLGGLLDIGGTGPHGRLVCGLLRERGQRTDVHGRQAKDEQYL